VAAAWHRSDSLQCLGAVVRQEGRWFGGQRCFRLLLASGPSLLDLPSLSACSTQILERIPIRAVARRRGRTEAGHRRKAGTEQHLVASAHRLEASSHSPVGSCDPPETDWKRGVHMPQIPGRAGSAGGMQREGG
jgi:hypothetical protein